MFKRINVSKIIKDHYKTLCDISDGKTSLSDVAVFYVIPLILSVLLSINSISIKAQISNIITALSILAGFLFNLLAIIYTALGKIKSELKDKDNITFEEKVRLLFANEIHVNVSYNITVALFAIIILIINSYDICFDWEICHFDVYSVFNISLEILSYFLIFHFTLTLFMILNRIYILLNKE